MFDYWLCSRLLYLYCIVAYMYCYYYYQISTLPVWHWREYHTTFLVSLCPGNLPVIIMGPQNMTVLITNGNPGKVEFSCATEETADHKWTIIKPGKHNVHRTQLNRSSSVHHVSINMSNNGTQLYCEATNGSGTMQSQTATLTVLG